MSMYEVLLFGHISFVVTWVGSNICMQVLALRSMRAGPARTAEFLGDVEWLGKYLQAPAAILVLVFGVLLAHEGDYDFSDTWIVLALTGFGLSFLVNAIYLGPQSAKIMQLVREHGPESPRTQARVRRVVFVSRIELLILIAIILDMVTKPGLEATSS